MTYLKIFSIALILLWTPFQSYSQSNPLPYFSTGKGLGITANDSSFSLNIRFRMQNRAAFSTESESDLHVKDVEARVRRARVRFDGFVYSKKLTYTLQLSFSRSDMDWDVTGVPNVVRDAYIQYALTPTFSVGFGQTKLPGNRQRVTSSGDLQFADRSIASSAFNIDRDFGAQFIYRRPFVVFRGAISTGEGRNSNTSDNGLAYTGRVEFLPFGAFTNGGEYFEGDILRETKPKLAIGIVGHRNENATRSGGQTGVTLYETRDLASQIVDLIFKYNGWAFTGEYLTRNTGNPVTEDEGGNRRYVYVGTGQNYQLSYCFENKFEVVSRYTSVNPDAKIEVAEKYKEQYTLGLNKYLKGHRVKLQTDATLEKWVQESSGASGAFWMYRFQIELGI